MMAGFFATMAVACGFLASSLLIVQLGGARKRSRSSRRDIESDVESLRKAVADLTLRLENFAKHALSGSVK